MKKEICLWNKFGFCQFLEKCNLRHVNEKCTKKECKVYECEERHPKPCKYLRDYKYCKFNDYCRFEHEHRETISKATFDKLTKLEVKIPELDKKLKNVENSEKKLESTEQTLKTIEKQVNDSIVLKEVVVSLKETIQENNVKFNELEKKFEDMSKKHAEEIEILNMKHLEFLKYIEEKERLTVDMAKQIQTNRIEINTLSNAINSDEDENESDEDDEDKENTNKQDNIENIENESENVQTGLEMTFMNPSECLKCGDCSFTAKNLTGLKMHRRAKHKAD